MSTDKVWWYAKGDKSFGPHTATEMKALAVGKQLAPTDMVWKEGLTDWLPASSVHGLMPDGAGGASTPPPIPGVGTPPPPPVFPQETQKMSGAEKGAIWGAVLFVLIAFVVSDGLDDGNKRSPGHQASAPAANPPPQSVKVGDLFTTPTYEIQIRSAQARSSVGNAFFASQPSEGGTYIAIQWAYKNISKKPVNAFRRPAVHLVSPDGTRYDPDLGASLSYAREMDIDRKALSNLNPGIRVIDAAVFEVSRQMFNPSSWRILVDADRDTVVEFGVANQ
ncbi:MAG: GYF domain-containing protein [Gammaproteobacteria bacterium]